MFTLFNYKIDAPIFQTNDPAEMKKHIEGINSGWHNAYFVFFANRECSLDEFLLTDF